VRDLNELLQTVFDQAVTRLQLLGVQLPDRQYISGGSALAYDSDQFTVNLNRVSGGRPVAEDTLQFNPFRTYFAEVQVTLLRRAPMIGTRGALPSVTDEETSAAQQLADMMNLSQVMGDMAADGTLCNGYRGIPVAVGPTTPYGPEGGLVGSLVVVSVQVV
jgi:hypothetical protein